MANRFRAAIHGTGEEILSAGKQQEGKVSDFVKIREALKRSIPTDDTVAVDSTVPRDATAIVEQATQEEHKIAFEAISDFLRGKVNNKIFELRMNKIKDILNALIDYSTNFKPIELIDSSENVKYWVQAIMASLPSKLSKNIDFIIDESDDKKFSLCHIYIRGIDNFNEAAATIRFDFLKGTSNNITLSTRFSELVQVGFLLHEESFFQFKLFVNEFNYEKLNLDIDDCLVLYYILNRGMSSMDSESIRGAFSFAQKYAPIHVKNEIFGKMELSYDIEVDAAAYLITSLLKLSINNQNESLAIKGYKYFFEYLKTALDLRDGEDVQVVYDFYDAIVNAEENIMGSFIDFTLSNENVLAITKYISKFDEKYALFYGKILLKLLKENKIDWQKNSIICDFLSKAVEALVGKTYAIKELLQIINGEVELEAEILCLYNDAFKNEERKIEAVKLFIEYKGLIEPDREGDLVKAILKKRSGMVLIFKEYKESFNLAQDKRKYFWEYKHVVFDKYIDYHNLYFSKALEFYLINLKDETVYKEEAYILLNMVSVGQLYVETDILKANIERLEENLPLGKTDMGVENIKNLILKVKEIKGINTLNSTSILLSFGNKLSSSVYIELGDTIRYMPDLNSISAKRLNEFLVWCLDILLDYKGAALNTVIDFYYKVIRSSGVNPSYGLQMLLEKSKESFSKLIEDRVRLQFFLSIILNHMKEEEAQWSASGELEVLLKELMSKLSKFKKESEQVLDYYETSPYFTNLLLFYYDFSKETDKRALDYLYIKMEGKGENWILRLREKISKFPLGLDFLYGELKYQLDNNTSKNDFFWEYKTSVFDAIPEYSSIYEKEGLEYYLSVIINTPSYNDECIKTLKVVMGDGIVYRKDTLNRLIREYENTIAIASLEGVEESFLQKVSDTKIKNFVITYPDITGLISLGLSLEKAEDAKATDILSRTKINTVAITRDKYKDLINWCLPIIASKIDINIHLETIKKVFYNEEFKEIYSKFFNEIIILKLDCEKTIISPKLLKPILLANCDLDVMSQILLKYFKKCKVKDSLRDATSLISEIFINKGEDFTRKLMKQIYENLEGRELIFEEYKYSLSLAQNRSLYFWNYLSNTFERIDRYKKDHFIDAIKVYLPSLKRDEYARECCRLFNYSIDNKILLQEDLLKDIMIGAQDNLRIGDPDEKELTLIKNIITVKEERAIEITPNIIGLIDFGARLQRARDTEEVRNLITNTNLNLHNFNPEKYEESLEWCLPTAIFSVNQWQAHVSIKRLLCEEDHAGIFFTKYLGVLEDILDKFKVESYKVFSEFLIYFINSREQLGDIIFIQIRAQVINILQRQNEGRIKEIGNQFKAIASSLNNREQVLLAWDNITLKLSFRSKVENRGIFSRFTHRS
ncbi:MAG TPA: hypothetical protein VIK72_15465 [Clostridiaceae bacterium]